MTSIDRNHSFTIGTKPFVAGAIVVRNHARLLKQREKARRWTTLVERFRHLGARAASIELPERFTARRSEPTPVGA